MNRDSGIFPARRVIAGWTTKYSPTPQDVVLTMLKYPADERQLALVVSAPDGERLCTASVCLEGFKPSKLGEVAIKNWSENEGVYEALLAANVIYPAHAKFPTGFVEALICQLKGQ